MYKVELNMSLDILGVISYTSDDPNSTVFSCPPGEPRGVLPIMAYMGRFPPERGTFFSLQVYARVGILLVEVYERVEKFVIWVCERAQRAEQMNFMALLSRENVLFFIDFYLNDNAFTAIQGDVKF